MTNSKIYTLTLVFLILTITGWFGRSFLYSQWGNWRGDFEVFNDPALQMIKHDIDSIVSMPPPLRNENDSPRAFLTINGSVAETNRHRTENGLTTLQLNAELQKMAELKIDDMFAQQYFEHESPQGEGPADLARKANYQYITVGENLALGNFQNDAALLLGWMNSPGHRENILNPNYTEIGIAVRQGVFEGKKTWLAVQEFGAPASSCPAADQNLQKLIEENQSELNRQEIIVNRKKNEIDEYEPKRGSEYETKVREYNDLVGGYNALIQITKEQVSRYNNQVNTYNSCLEKYSHD